MNRRLALATFASSSALQLLSALPAAPMDNGQFGDVPPDVRA
jgi:hypothetical protein